jgi:general stress protein 26
MSNFSTVMLITMAETAGCHARPMAAARVDGNSGLWLLRSGESEKVREIEADARVQVHGQDGWTKCAVLAGRAMVVDDRAMIHEI